VAPEKMKTILRQAIRKADATENKEHRGRKRVKG
jgi:hypothetical protein